ncbi:hypothetical protein BDV96DRAFT_136624 [Lophiotrema nucula]|uniref:Uncharacterized protein n=1 Tax=Lophiotrema nucula TaxID=690887 RepID=A0A6A5ZUN2_9PLEO|nr:hypothetical protein BDV96DRAFT_136624 [Lophiotrema nucula]
MLLLAAAKLHPAKAMPERRDGYHVLLPVMQPADLDWMHRMRVKEALEALDALQLPSAVCAGDTYPAHRQVKRSLASDSGTWNSTGACVRIPHDRIWRFESLRYRRCTVIEIEAQRDEELEASREQGGYTSVPAGSLCGCRVAVAQYRRRWKAAPEAHLDLSQANPASAPANACRLSLVESSAGRVPWRSVGVSCFKKLPCPQLADVKSSTVHSPHEPRLHHHTCTHYTRRTAQF